jgi:hypothetical protein
MSVRPYSPLGDAAMIRHSRRTNSYNYTFVLIGILLGLYANVAPAHALEPISFDRPDTAGRAVMAAIIDHDLAAMEGVFCQNGSSAECEVPPDTIDWFKKLDKYKIKFVKTAIDRELPDALRQIYYYTMLNDSTPTYFAMTFAKTDGGWLLKTLSFATVDGNFAIPPDLQKGSLLNIAYPPLPANATVASEANDPTASAQAIMAALSRQDFDTAEKLLREQVPANDKEGLAGVSAVMTVIRPLKVTHVRKVIDKQIDGVARQVFFYAAMDGSSPFFLRFSYFMHDDGWKFENLVVSSTTDYAMPLDMLDGSLVGMDSH